MRLSQNFTLAEAMQSQEAARRGIDNTPSPEILKNMINAAVQMQEVRKILGHKPISVSSWYRCPALNKAVRGSKTSAHMTGWAVDFNCFAEGTPYRICSILKASGLKYDQLIHEFENWVHISFAPAMRQELLTINKSGTFAGLR